MKKGKPNTRERRGYHERKVTILTCTPGNFDHGDGDKVVIQTIADNTSIEPQAFPIQDAKLIATKMLGVLATYGDALARQLLDDYFDSDKGGNPAWPNEPYGLESSVFDNEDAEQEERPEYYATECRAMNCTRGHLDHAGDERAVIQTIGKGMDIEQQVFPIEDAKLIVTKMLVALATYRDGFARKLLDDRFGSDKDGNFVWPSEPYLS